jgi:cytochrome c553
LDGPPGPCAIAGEASAVHTSVTAAIACLIEIPLLAFPSTAIADASYFPASPASQKFGFPFCHNLICLNADLLWPEMLDLVIGGSFMLLRRLAAFMVIMLAPVLPATAQSGATGDAIKGCEFCHGAQGNSSYDLIPRLNGQQFDYLLARMREFGTVTPDTARGVNTMAHAANVDEPLRAEIAGYFSRQAATVAEHAVAEGTQGQGIYDNGITAKKIASCRSCHGPAGEGAGTVPRLAGQHASYLKTRLWILTRFDLPGNRGMHRSTAALSGPQMDAVISYLANQ